MSRTIVIGDVHGCWQELRDLLREVRATDADRLISVGDLICKGPDSRGVMEWAMRAKNLEVVVGNHELRFLSHYNRGATPDEKPYDLETYRQLGSAYEPCMRFIGSWPLVICARSFLVVHAGFDPRERSITRQDPWRLTNIRRLLDTETPWYHAYDKSRLVVYGHWAKPRPEVRENSVGLDTGCVYGGALSALILPERRIVSVPARRAYQRKEGWITKPLTLEAA